MGGGAEWIPWLTGVVLFVCRCLRPSSSLSPVRKLQVDLESVRVDSTAAIVFQALPCTHVDGKGAVVRDCRLSAHSRLPQTCLSASLSSPSGTIIHTCRPSVGWTAPVACEPTAPGRQ
jgi:hypothetical protein